jgi:hypothetical protein
VLCGASLAAHGFIDDSFLLSLPPICFAEPSQGIRCAATAPVLSCANLSEHEQQIILSTSGFRASDLLHFCGIFDTSQEHGRCRSATDKRLAMRQQSKTFLQIKVPQVVKQLLEIQKTSRGNPILFYLSGNQPA